jgi:hypothetical protein
MPKNPADKARRRPAKRVNGAERTAPTPSDPDNGADLLTSITDPYARLTTLTVPCRGGRITRARRELA